MVARGVVRGQRVVEVKGQRARELRRTMTPAEARLWQRLRRGGLAGLHFRRQQVVDGFIVDFYCDRVGLVVEVDGGVHQEQRDYDTDRDQLFIARGLQVLRVTNDEADQDVASVLARILDRSQANTGADRCPGY